MRGDLIQLTSLLKNLFTPKSFMEIGSRNGVDAKYVCEYWDIQPENAYIVEANIFCYQDIRASMVANGQKPFAKVIYGACSNKDEMANFNCVMSSNQEIVGISSLKKHSNLNLNYQTTRVECFRVEKILKEKQIDLFKIDVEGHGYEVLEGMGDEISNVKAIQIETEDVPNFENQKLDIDVHNFLIDKGFELFDKKPCWASQFDCLYINKKQNDNSIIRATT
jgi:FkbM family methyltransferase